MDNITFVRIDQEGEKIPLPTQEHLRSQGPGP